MARMGFDFIDKVTRYPNKVVYAPILQPIPKEGLPQGSWWDLVYLIAEKRNENFK